jgi:hypothetical protein
LNKKKNYCPFLTFAFPKNKNAQCPMDGSPGKIDQKQLKELSIDLVGKAKVKKGQ